MKKWWKSKNQRWGLEHGECSNSYSSEAKTTTNEWPLMLFTGTDHHWIKSKLTLTMRTVLRKWDHGVCSKVVNISAASIRTLVDCGNQRQNIAQRGVMFCAVVHTLFWIKKHLRKMCYYYNPVYKISWNIFHLNSCVTHSKPGGLWHRLEHIFNSTFTSEWHVKHCSKYADMSIIQKTFQLSNLFLNNTSNHWSLGLKRTFSETVHWSWNLSVENIWNIQRYEKRGERYRPWIVLAYGIASVLQ